MRFRPRYWLPAVIIVVVCVGVPVTLWSTVIAEYNNLPQCPGSFGGEPETSREPFTDITGPDDDSTPELGTVLSVEDLTLTEYRGLAYDTVSGHGSSPDGKDITRLIKADGSGYQKVAIPQVMDYSVAPDRERAAVVEDVGAPASGFEPTDRLGIQDLESGSLDWLPLPENATKVAWSPVEDTVVVVTDEPGKILSVDPDGGEVTTLALPEPLGDKIPTTVLWQPDGERFIATAVVGEDEWASAEVSLDGGAERLPVAVGGIGLSPSGSYSGVDPGDELDSEIVDVASGATATAAGFEACASHGNVHEFLPQAWLDDDRLIAIESDNEWVGDKRWGEPGREARGNRLVIVDLDGVVQEAITDWGVTLPDAMSFTPDPR